MRLLDVVALILVVGALLAFALGSAAIGRSEDFQALYYLVAGLIAVRAAVQIARPEGR
jgi:hypothetical protein